ncbi:MAG: DUF3955 domain-containing protein [Kiritimatiellia bacterium]|jgi:hypothetical protein|nr:DUF3955 domain-containing protein [Kiritimatiellia bacterium]
MLFSGLFFLLTGVVFLFLENTFYQYLDEDGFLHESLFLPLGVFALIIGSLLLFTLVLKKVWQSLFTKNRESK